MAFLDSTFYGNPLATWLLALLVAAAVFALLNLFRSLALRHISRIAGRTPNQLDDLAADLLRRTRTFLPVFLGLWAGSLVLDLPGAVAGAVRTATILALVVQGALWSNRVVDYLIQRTVQRRLEQDAAAATMLGVLGFIARLLVWAILILVALDNLGIDITGLVAGLGIGGIAVALAVQNVLGDLFASLAIVMDKPFVVGDAISVDQHTGTVEYIGLKTTRLRSVSGEQLIFANTDLLRSRIRNFKRMFERRVVFTIGVTYRTPRARLEEIPGMLRAAVEAQPGTRFDRAHFTTFGDSALIFEVAYFVLVPDYGVYRDIQQAINLEVHRRFEEAGIEFAYPTRTILLQPSGAPAAGHAP